MVRCGNSKYSLKKSFRLIICYYYVYKLVTKYTQKVFYMWIADHWKDYEVFGYVRRKS